MDETTPSLATQIKLNKFKPRDYQKPLFKAFFSGKYHKFLLVNHRRFGKDYEWFWIVIVEMAKHKGLYLYCLPTFSQGRSVLWKGKTNTGDDFLDLIPPELISKKREDKMEIEFHNGSVFRVIGSNAWRTSIIGQNCRLIVFSEYALCDDNAYKMGALPILRGNGGKVAIVSTPRGRNGFYEMYNIAKNSPDWYTELLTIDDTGVISKEEVQKEIDSGEMSWDLAQQEYYCFPGDMKVTLKNSVKKIKNIKIGDLVLTHKGNYEKVIGVYKSYYKGELEVINGSLECTPNHKLFARDDFFCKWKDPLEELSWRPARHLILGDGIYSPKSKTILPILSINNKAYEGIVYNLSVEYDESYCVDGIAVHNCSFELGQEGSLYAKYINKMRLNDQIGHVPWDPNYPCHTAWDLGILDPTVILVFQVVNDIVRVINFYSSNDKPSAHFANWVFSHEYVYKKHFPPHDVMKHELGTGLTVREAYKRHGINFSDPINISLEEGIENVRRSFSKIWIDETKCAPLIRALENYRYEYDRERGIYKDKPCHDKYSDPADAFRYLCLALPLCKTTITADDIDRNYREAMYSNDNNISPVFKSDVYKR